MTSDKRIVEFKLLVEDAQSPEKLNQLRQYVRENLSMVASESNSPYELCDEVMLTDEVDSRGRLVAITGKLSHPPHASYLLREVPPEEYEVPGAKRAANPGAQ